MRQSQGLRHRNTCRLRTASRKIKQLLTDGPAAAAEGTLAGTHDGVLHAPDGDVAPTGRAVELRWAAVYHTDGDTLKSEHLFFDQMDFLGQLDLLPE